MESFIKKYEKNVEIALEINLIKDGEYIVAYCPSLELSSFGKTEKEAKASFDEALDIFMEYCIEHGTLEKNLLNLGWSLRKLPTVKYEPPKIKAGKNSLKAAHSTFKERVSIPVC
jgi:predicted RNase H-like HicB family nuclease